MNRTSCRSLLVAALALTLLTLAGGAALAEPKDKEQTQDTVATTARVPATDANWVFSNGFEDDIPGMGEWQKAWGSPWGTPSHPLGASVGASAVEGRRCLRVAYPKDGVGPQQTGIQWPTETALLKGIEANYEELYLRYYVFFEDGFDFRIGGKLPGLMSTGGGGGFEPDGTNAWLMRFMWREDAEAVVYSLLPPSKFNNFKTSLDVPCNFKFKTGKWYCIEQYAKLNTVGKEDGRVMSWAPKMSPRDGLGFPA